MKKRKKEKKKRDYCIQQGRKKEKWECLGRNEAEEGVQEGGWHCITVEEARTAALFSQPFSRSSQRHIRVHPPCLVFSVPSDVSSSDVLQSGKFCLSSFSVSLLNACFSCLQPFLDSLWCVFTTLLCQHLLLLVAHSRA